MMNWRGIGLALGLLAALALPGAAARAAGTPPLVFAAASLKEALDAVTAEWAHETGKTVRISYAGSSLLAKQIGQGAPADLFISADLDWMDYLDARHLLKAKSRIDLLGNRLVLVAPKGSAVSLTIAPGVDLAHALGTGRLAMADTRAVPAGKYGKAALEKLGVWASVENRIAQAENVRAALAFVARGEAPLGIVYRTDALAEPAVRIVAVFPEDTHPPIVYPAALTAASRNEDAAAFLGFLSSARAGKIFKAHGFTTLK
ncbi:MAG: molybdate ABC transporter substrate-binding protein [Parvibaculum sp.]|uniref:molybdate ABC transporter substrate-binding protein n=1 Tax=Parvibaculum sp. TaxID=2024848 RepID=UPI003C75D9F0